MYKPRKIKHNDHLTADTLVGIKNDNKISTRVD